MSKLRNKNRLVTLYETVMLMNVYVYLCEPVQCDACCYVRNWTAHHVAAFCSMVTFLPRVKA